MKNGFSIFFVVILLLIALSFKGCYTIDAGSVGLKTSWGRIVSGPVEPGLTWVNPIGGDVVKYDCREQRSDLDLNTYTKDVQTANLRVTITYAIKREAVARLHSDVGRFYLERIVTPAIVGVTKDVIGQWEADRLINGREEATHAIFEQVSARLAEAPVTVNQLVIANIDYSDAFEKAIEQKQVAMQDAIRAKNKTQQIEEEARQKVISAKAEAESMQIRGDALKANPGLVSLEAVGKWDGRAPQTLVIGSDLQTMLPVAQP